MLHPRPCLAFAEGEIEIAIGIDLAPRLRPAREIGRYACPRHGGTCRAASVRHSARPQPSRLSGEGWTLEGVRASKLLSKGAPNLGMNKAFRHVLTRRRPPPLETLSERGVARQAQGRFIALYLNEFPRYGDGVAGPPTLPVPTPRDVCLFACCPGRGKQANSSRQAEAPELHCLDRKWTRT